MASGKSVEELSPGSIEYLESREWFKKGGTIKSIHIALALRYLRTCPLGKLPHYINHHAPLVQEIIQERLRSGKCATS